MHRFTQEKHKAKPKHLIYLCTMEIMFHTWKRQEVKIHPLLELSCMASDFSKHFLMPALLRWQKKEYNFQLKKTCKFVILTKLRLFDACSLHSSNSFDFEEINNELRFWYFVIFVCMY